MPRITESDLIMHWPLAPPVTITPLERGANNRSFLVVSGSGDFILKWYRNVDVDARHRFEQALLGELEHAGLPFAVPAPLRSRSGDTIVRIETDSEPLRLALFRRIPGRAATFGDPLETSLCGAALASLHLALASVTLDPNIPVPDAFGDLALIHPRVPDPIEALQRRAGSGGDAKEVAQVVSRVEERWQHHTSGWTRQIIHGDFYPSNTLVNAGEVSGMLDFEFSGMGYRSMDFAIGLAAFSTENWEVGCSWSLVDAFASGYLRRTPLSERDLIAVPHHMLMREACSLIHWLGRMEQGLTTLDDFHERVGRFLALDRWLTANQGQLVHRLIEINVG